MVERKHRQLLDVVRASKFHSHLPNIFWSECILIATCLLNRLPIQLLPWKTPYELLFNHPPNYSHLKILGCLCFVTNVSPYKDEFSRRVVPYVFIGYPRAQKGYKLYNMETK